MGQPGAVAPDTVLLGRVTYQLFESHWPKVADDPNAPKEARITADELNRMTKVVFSKTLKEASWENTKLVNGDVAEEVGGLKQEKGSDVLGKSLFIGVKRVGLELLESRNFKSGNVLLRYKIGK